MRTMVDACDPDHLPSGHDLTASYVDAGCASTRSTPVRISSVATDAGNCGDCEPGNPGWSTWVQWVLRRRAAGVDPTLYCMDDGYGAESTWGGWRHADGVQAFALAGVAEPHWWVCHPGLTTIPSYAVAVQTQLGIAPGYDLSIVADHWPGVDPAEESDVDRQVISAFGAGQALVNLDRATVTVLTGPDVTALEGQGVPVAQLSGAMLSAFTRLPAPAPAPAGGAVGGSGQVSGTITITPEPG